MLVHDRRNCGASSLLLGQGRLEVMFPEHQDVDVADEGPWIAREGEIAARFVEFLGWTLR